MTYIDAIHNRKTDKIQVVERVNGERRFLTIQPKYVFYYKDKNGKFKSIYGDTLSRFETNNYGKFAKELAIMNDKELFESDTNVLFRVLADNYMGAETPSLHVGLFDIEVDFDPERGYANPAEPHSAVTAITVYLNWLKRYVTLCIKPKTLSKSQAQEIVSKFDNTYLFDCESDMLESFLDTINDCDVISGWNSTFFDMPYMIERIKLVLGKDFVTRFCLWDQKPQQRMVEKFKKEHVTYELVGRIHLDYMELFQKHSLQEYHSYSLDYIGEVEVGERKTPYDGTLDALYNYDFEKFIEYNRQDVHVLVKLDEKRGYIELANQVAHTNCVLLKTTMGSVGLIDQAIINEAHSMGMMVHDRKVKPSEEFPAAGAYVADPIPGLHEHLGAVDINSLYPSAIRALNMCSETLVGQLRPINTTKLIKYRVDVLGMSATDAWHEMFGTVEFSQIHDESNSDSIKDFAKMGHVVSDEITVDFEDGTSTIMTPQEIRTHIFGNPKYCISANGTIFRTDITGVIPHLLARWYNERKQMQAEKDRWKEIRVGNPEKKIEPATDPIIISECKRQEEFWDKRQYVRKILLNSLYGALLNEGSRFYDRRIGQSVTLTGRCITRHMISAINELIEGTYVHHSKSIIYGDSVSADSVINTSAGELTIEELFYRCANRWSDRDKEFSTDAIQVLTYDPIKEESYYDDINFVCRHETSKEKWLIEDEYGNQIIITNDHSVMVERNGILIEVKPSEMHENDVLILNT